MCKDGLHEMPRHGSRHIKSIVGDNVRAARMARGMTQRDLAAELGMDAMAVSRWERGRVMPESVATMPRLAAALDVPIGWLYTDHEEEAA